MYRKLDEETISSILEAGIEEFSKNGPEKVSMVTIAARAEVSVGVIYKYFGDKEGFFLACVRHSLKLLDNVLSEAVSDESDIEESVDSIIHALIRNARSHSSYNAMYNEISSGSCRRYAAMLSSEIESRSAMVYSALVEKAIAQGRVRADADPGMSAFFFDSLLITLQFSFSCDYYRERMKLYCGEDVFGDDEKLVRAFKQFIFNGLMKNKDDGGR